MHIFESILCGILGDDDGGENFGDVILGFAGEVVSLVEFPVIGVAGFLDGALDVACAPVVGGHGKVPVAELVVEELHVAGVGAGGFFRIESLVDPGVAGESVVSVGHELPHASGAGAAVDGVRLEAGFRDGEIDEILGHAFFAKHALDHGLVSAAAFEGMLECVVTALGVCEEVDESADVVIDDEWEIGLGGGEFFAGLGDEVWIDFEGDVVGDVGWSWLDGRSKPIALLEGFHFERVDGIEDAIEFTIEQGVGVDVEAAGEHEVDGGVEVHFGLDELAFAVVQLAAVKGTLDLLDEGLGAALLRGEGQRGLTGGLRWCGLWDGWRSDLRSDGGGSVGVIARSASAERSCEPQGKGERERAMDGEAEVAHKRETRRVAHGHWLGAEFKATHPMISYEHGVMAP